MSEPADNVVRLPRDWLGPKDWLEPRDELVPLGRPAASREADAESSHGADAFWSESSAAIQDAVQAPGWGATWGQDGSDDVRADRSGIRILGRLRSSKRHTLVAAALVVLGVASLIGALQPVGSTARRPLAVAGHRALGSTAHAASSSSVVGRSQAQDRVGHARVTASARERPSSHASPIRSRPTGVRPDTAAPTGTQTVAVSQPVTPSASTAPAASPAAGSSGDGGSGGGAPASSGPGPVGAGAPFGPGRLG